MRPQPPAPHQIELWHTQLGVRPETEGPPTVERSAPQRIIRAVWTPRPGGDAEWETLRQPLHENVPFRMSLDSADRHMLVRQSV